MLEFEPEERAALTMRINANASFSNTDIKDAISKQLASIMICSKYLIMTQLNLIQQYERSELRFYILSGQKLL